MRWTCSAKEGHVFDTATNGEVKVGRYLDGGQNIIRTQALDCPVGPVASACPDSAGAGPGGYTYGDMGKVDVVPESHADGEIWAETLWDLRRRLIADHGTADGVARTQLLVTAGMELSPTQPSFLDMRDAILQSDTIYNGGQDRQAI